MSEKMLRIQNLYNLIDPEPYFLIGAFVLLSWTFYKLFLRDVSQERHQNLKGHFRSIFKHFMIFSFLFSSYILLARWMSDDLVTRVLPYVAFLTLVWGMAVFVKTSRLIILQYLFLGSMQAGVPLLIVNIFSLLLSITLALWTANQIFGFQVAPLLATSAAFSIILGLAIQDTLGNLFAGISLQLDKCFEIGDWVEITSAGQKTIGQVKEISWRATLLIGLAEEKITIPNRVLASAQVSNFTNGEQPIIRSQTFKIPYETNMDLARQCLLESISQVDSVLKYPEPIVFASEPNESWMALRLIYFVQNYGSQFSVADKVIDSALRYLQANKIGIAPQKILVEKQ